MTSPKQHTYEEVIEIIRQLSKEDRERLFREDFSDPKSAFPEIDTIIDFFHKKYEQVYKTLA